MAWTEATDSGGTEETGIMFALRGASTVAPVRAMQKERQHGDDDEEHESGRKGKPP